MQCFDLDGAKHFCSGAQTATASRTDSMRGVADALRKAKDVGETDPLFAVFRTACLSDVERHLFLAASQYRRGCDLLGAGSAHWALVTFYYATFSSAKALLGMFGVWLDDGHVVSEVDVARPGAQRVRFGKKSPASGSGSHQRFWAEFYQSANSIKPWVEPSEQWVLSPVRGDVWYLISTRNAINYEALKAIDLAGEFQGSFSPGSFPACLRGDLHQQYTVADAMLILCFRLATDFGFSTRALEGLVPAGARKEKIRDLVVRFVSPDLREKVREAELLT